MMQINFRRFIVNMLPVKLRTISLYALIYSLFNGIVDIYNRLTAYSDTISYKLKHTSQVWSIQKVLNDEFDPSARRIRVTDSGDAEVILLNMDADQMPVLLDSDGYDPILLHADSNYFASGFDFIVDVPFTIDQGQIYRLRTLVDYYRLAGKRYDVITH